MLKFTPILLALLYGLAMYRFSVWRTAKELDQNSTFLADPSLLKVTRALAQALDLPRIKVHIYEIEPINGLAAPDGRIFITRGFYKKFLNGEVTDTELASVIAHELGHVALGHTRRRMIDFSGQNALRTALIMILGRIIPGLGILVANMATRMVAAGLSRTDEYEADEYASALMIKAGFGVAPQISMFEKLEALSGGRAGSGPVWLLSHPKTPDRIAAIHRNSAKWQGLPT